MNCYEFGSRFGEIWRHKAPNLAQFCRMHTSRFLVSSNLVTDLPVVLALGELLNVSDVAFVFSVFPII